MTTRRWFVAVILLAGWLGFVARAERLRRLGRGEMREYTLQTRQVQELRTRQAVAQAEAVRVAAAAHLRSAHDYNVEADFVESFSFTLPLSALAFAVIAFIRQRRAAAETSAAS